MTGKPSFRSLIVVSCVALLIFQGAAVTFAQRGIRDAGSKIRRDYKSFHTSASRNMRNSRNTSRDLRTYARNNQAVTPAVARAHAEELGHSIKLTQKNLAEERKLAEGDQETLVALTQVDKLVAKEAAEQEKLHKACSGDNVDAAAATACCEEGEDALEKAIAIHDEIISKLEDGK